MGSPVSLSPSYHKDITFISDLRGWWQEWCWVVVQREWSVRWGHFHAVLQSSWECSPFSQGIYTLGYQTITVLVVLGNHSALLSFSGNGDRPMTHYKKTQNCLVRIFRILFCSASQMLLNCLIEKDLTPLSYFPHFYWGLEKDKAGVSKTKILGS